MRILKRLKKQAGFSVMEVLLSTFLMSIGLFGGVTTLQNSVLHTAKADLATVATALAQSDLEEVLADHKFKGYDYIKSYYSLKAKNYGSDHSGFAGLIDVTEVDPVDLVTPLAGSGLALVKITVAWGNRNSEAVYVNTVLTSKN